MTPYTFENREYNPQEYKKLCDQKSELVDRRDKVEKLLTQKVSQVIYIEDLKNLFGNEDWFCFKSEEGDKAALLAINGQTINDRLQKEKEKVNNQNKNLK